ncbi:MAG TPA: hypothetical protein VNK23_01385 [Candidatus Dormibacteraeota bacterium]|nr:hypothetical protein [Candidatus Dormibacteraeota bacterium]
MQHLGTRRCPKLAHLHSSITVLNNSFHQSGGGLSAADGVAHGEFAGAAALELTPRAWIQPPGQL